jgi:dynein regulatory complex subunit 2
MNNNTKEYEEKNAALKEEKDAIQAQFQSLKKKMNNFRENQRQKLTQVSILSNSVVNVLKEKVEKAEMIIKLAEMNRKLETEGEKINPFYKEIESGNPKDYPQIEMDIKLPNEFHGMSQFNKRFNKVLLDKLAMKNENERLNTENSRLRKILKQYLDGITLSETVINQLNPLFVVNGKTNAPMRHHGQAHVTIVEANAVKLTN